MSRGRVLSYLIYLVFLATAVAISVTGHTAFLLPLLLLFVVVRSYFLRTALFGDSQPLSTADRSLATDLGFDEDVLAKLKRTAKAPLKRLSGNLGTGHEEPLPGIVVDVPFGGGRVHRVLTKLKAELLAKGYFLFLPLSDLVSVNGEASQIALLKTTDPYEVLQTMGTAGVNYGHDTGDVIRRLKDWAKQFEWELEGAGFDWLQLHLQTLPVDPVKFAQELYKFSPDIEDLGGVSAEEFADEIAESRTVILWWD